MAFTKDFIGSDRNPFFNNAIKSSGVVAYYRVEALL